MMHTPESVRALVIGETLAAQVVAMRQQRVAGRSFTTYNFMRQVGLTADACEWCGRAVKQNGEGRWYAVKGEERGYDPLTCEASDDRRHSSDLAVA